MSERTVVEAHGSARRPPSGRRRKRLLGSTAMGLVAGLVISLCSLVAPSVAGAEIVHGDVLVDDAGGHVFVTYGDTVRVFDLEGALVTTLANQPGAMDLMLRGRTLYVLASAGPRINAVDADTLTVTGGWDLGSVAGAVSMAWARNAIWFTYGSSVGKLDPATGAVTPLAINGGYGGSDIATTESPARLYLLDRGGSPAKVWKYDISTATPTLLTSTPHSTSCSNGQEMALSPDGGTIWTACGSPYQFDVYDTAILGTAVDHYQASNYPNGIGVSADGHFLAGGTDSYYGPDVRFYEVGTYAPIRTWEIGPGDLVPGMVAVSNHGSHVYAVAGTGVLHTWTLAPRISSVSPAHVAEADPSVVTVEGTEMGEVTSATVGGVQVDVDVLDETTIELTLPGTIAAGVQPVIVTNRWGTSLPGTASTVTVDLSRPDAPARPAVSAVGVRSLTVDWSAPDSNGHPITASVVKVYGATTSTLVKQVEVGPGTTSTTVGGLISERAYRFTVAATNSVGTGAASPYSLPVAAGNPDIGPYDTLGDLVDHAFLDFEDRLPTKSERSAAVSSVADGSLSPGEHLASHRRNGDATASVDPVARLYRAAFSRNPDPSGLRHWVARKRDGAKLDAIAETFARSGEFTRRYGRLSDRGYVQRLYLNVLGRTGDPGGIDYWTARLTAKTRTRGQVLASMSESGENRRRQAAEVDVAVLYVALLHRGPTTLEFSTQVAMLDAGGSIATLATQLLLSPEYASRH